MLRVFTLPACLRGMLVVYRSCFTAPSFEVFMAVVVGAVMASGRRSVVGMVQAAGLARVWPHDRVHYFFARAVWDAGRVGTLLAQWIVARLVEPGAPVVVAVDDTLFKRAGRQVFGRSWQHDGAAKGPRGERFNYGVCFVVVAIVVRVPFRSGPVALPVLAVLWSPRPAGGPGAARRPRVSPVAAAAKRVQRAQARVQRAQAAIARRVQVEARAGGRPPGSVPDLATPLRVAQAELAAAQAAHAAVVAGAAAAGPARRRGRAAAPAGHPGHATKTELALALVTRLAAALPGRPIHVVADSAYHSPALRILPPQVTWTFRLGSAAVLHATPPPPAPRTPGRPRITGDKLGTSEQIAATATFTAHQVEHGARRWSVTAATLTCLWQRSMGSARLRLILVRNPGTTTGHDLALLTTDPTATVGDLVARYACRWTIEVVFQESRQHLGAGQPPNRTQQAVRRTIPFQLITYSIVICWYTQHGYHPDDLSRRRTAQPWYPTKTEPSFHDMINKLRRVIIDQHITDTTPDQQIRDKLKEITTTWPYLAA